MRRDRYKLFSPGAIGTLQLPNRWVRSATWDPSILQARKMNDNVLQLYREVAAGGVGLIITGDFCVVPAGALDESMLTPGCCSYQDIRIEGFDELIDTVLSTSADCKIVAQISGDYPGVAPSDIPSPYTLDRARVLTAEEIRLIVQCFIEAIAGLHQDGFDGVQLHAAHGGLLSRFLSPYSNHRTDEYGGSVENRARIVKEIVTGARVRVGSFPILIKMNCTDYLEGGIDIQNFPEIAGEIAETGVDAIEISGGMWESLVRTEAELGFRPVPAPESHTRIKRAAKQSYFLRFAERLNLSIPVILGGGNQDVESLEEIVQGGKVDFISLCRPLINEPGLPRRWLEGQGSSSVNCISCNSCIYDMITNVERGEMWVARCVLTRDKDEFKKAQRWLSSWVKENVIA